MRKWEKAFALLWWTACAALIVLAALSIYVALSGILSFMWGNW